MLIADGGAGMRAALARFGTTEPSPAVARSLDLLAALQLSAADLSDMLVGWDRFKIDMAAFLDDVDVVVSPVATVPAPLHGTTFDQLGAFGYASVHNLTGWPVAVVRAGTSPEGLPIGVQVAAGMWREDVALAVAARLETALGSFAGAGD